MLSSEIMLEYRSSKNNVADILTKPLPRARFQELCRKLGLY